MIITIRTDKPEAEVGLYQDGEKLGYDTWQAHRELSATLHQRMENLLGDAAASWKDVRGIIFYKGPGSFTGLRIGAAVANAFAYAYGIPVASMNGEAWVNDGLSRVQAGGSGIALPEYGGEPHITKPRK